MKVKDTGRTWAGKPWTTADLFTPAIGAAVVWLITGVYALLGWQWWASLLVGAFVMVAALGASAGYKFSEALRGYLTGMALLTDAWMIWVTIPIAWTVHASTTVILGIIGSAVAIICWPSVRRIQMQHEARLRDQKLLGSRNGLVIGPEGLALDAARMDSDRRFWAALFAQTGRPGWLCEDVVSTPAGIAVHMYAPAGTRISQMIARTACENFESHLDVRPGAVRIERGTGAYGPSSRRIVMHVDFEDVLAKIFRMDDTDHTPISINHAFPVARLIDGTIWCLRLRDVHTMIVGATRAGKSNLLHIIIRQLTRCYDVAVWMIDLKGGATARPWLRPWVLKVPGVDRPILDWVAIDRWEAERILRACLAIVRGRPLRRRSGSKTEPARNGMPMANGAIADHDMIAVCLITDEVAELAGAHAGPSSSFEGKGITAGQVGKLLTSLACLAAGEGVYAVLAGQRNTNDMFANGSAQIQIKNRIAVGEIKAQDAAQLFPGNSQAASLATTLGNDPEHAGSIVPVGPNDRRVMAAKAAYAGDEEHLDDWVQSQVIAHIGICPSFEMDPLVGIANRFGYADRWTDRERCGWLYLADEELDDDQITWTGKPYLHGDTGASAPAQRTGAADDAPAPAPVTPAATSAGGTARGFWKRKRTDATTAAPAAPQLTDRQRIIRRVSELVDASGTRGMGAGQIAAALISEGLLESHNRTQVYRWISAARDDGGLLDPGMRIEQPGGAGKNYYTARHVNATTTSAAPAA